MANQSLKPTRNKPGTFSSCPQSIYIFKDVPSFVPIIYIKAGQNMDFSL